MHRSKLLLGFVVALGVGGLGAAAVAMENDTGGAGTLADDTTTTTLVVDPSTTTQAPNTTGAPTPEPALTAQEPTGDTGTTDPGVERSTEGCDGGTYGNHGDYVSSVAQNPDRQPGDVPAAAQSDCGKPITEVGGGDAGSETEAPETSPGNNAGNPGQGNGRGASGK